MKRVLKTTISLLALVLILSLSVFNCFAKGGLNLAEGVTAERGDTVTYTLFLADCESPVTDIVATLFYDSEYLELDKDSVDFHDLVGVNRNLDLENCIPFTFSAISSPVDFSKKKPVITVDFKVLKEGETAIKYFVTDLDCGTVNDTASAKNYTFTCDYIVHGADGDKVTENATPVLMEDKEQIDKYQGNFVNHDDGKGEQNGAEENHVAVTGEPQGAVDVAKNDNPNQNNNTTIIITVSIIVIALIIGIVLVLRRVFAGDSGEKENNDEEDVEETE